MDSMSHTRSTVMGHNGSIFWDQMSIKRFELGDSAFTISPLRTRNADAVFGNKAVVRSVTSSQRTVVRKIGENMFRFCG